MAYQLISVKCPGCGQTLSIEDSRTQAFCSYCGAKVLISNEKEFVFRQVDEAGIKKAETERLVRLKEMELQEQREKQSWNLRRMLTGIWLIVSAVLLTVIIVKMAGSSDGAESGFHLFFFLGIPVIGGGAYLIFHWLPQKENERMLEKRGGIRFPDGLEPFTDRKYFAMEESLRSAGFTNIKCVNLHDLNLLTLLVNGDKIEKVMINGRPITSGGKICMPDTPVVITYHGR